MGLIVALLLFALELANRLTLVGALLSVATDRTTAAALALAASLAGGARAFLRGELLMRRMASAWGAMVYGIRKKEVSQLQAYREDEDGVSMLVDAAREVAIARATFVPELAAQVVTMIVVAALVVAKLALAWLVAGVLVALVLGLAVRSAQRAQSRAQSTAYHLLGSLARDARALIEAAAELRGQGREEKLAGHLLSDSVRMAAHERTVQRLGAAMGLAPSLVALAALVMPASALSALADRSSLVDLGVLGGAAISVALGIVHTLEAFARARPYRETFARVAREPNAQPPRPVEALPLRALELRDLSVRYPTADRDTPHRLALSLRSGGVALVGPNGAGKSSAILALLGEVPHTGRILVDDRELDAGSLEGLRAAVSFVPQRPFVSVGETLRWHARLLVDDDDAVIERLREVGLFDVLERRRADARSVLDLRIGTLSGGERQRFFLARALAREARLLLLDEPEAALDGPARAILRGVLERAASRRLVIVVAHDESIVPPSFQHIRCDHELGTD